MGGSRKRDGGPSQLEVCGLYEAGVAAVVGTARRWAPEDWSKRACGEWDRADTVRHLCAVVEWYHSWLDRAIAGDASPPFDADEFATRNQVGVTGRQSLSGPEALDEFEPEAGSYLERATQNWDVPFGFPLGSVTVGQHAGIAAAEWHLHAWDLTSTDTKPHRPDDAAQLFRAAGAAVAAAEGGLRGRLTGLLVPIASRRSPWDLMLKRSGRTPNPDR